MLQGQGALHYFEGSVAQESRAGGKAVGKEARGKNSSTQQRRIALALERRIFTLTKGWSSLTA